MLFAPGDLLAAVRPHIDPLLLDDIVYRRLRTLFEALPPVWGWIVLECRLDGDPRVDALFETSRASHGDEKLYDYLKASPQNPHLMPLYTFLAAWSDPHGSLLREVPLIWLEYDVFPEKVSPPFGFVCVDPYYVNSFYPTSQIRPVLAPDRLRTLSEKSIGLLLERSPDTRILDRFEACARVLPDHAQFLHVAVMPHRGRDAIRTGAEMEFSHMHAWLEAIEWPGDKRRLDDLLAFLGPGWGRLALHIDVGRQVWPTLAMDYYLPTRSGAHPRWRAFASRLHAAGAVSEARFEAALRWIGTAKQRLPMVDFPVQITRHLLVKLYFHPNGRLEVKAYLCFHPRYTLF